MSFERRADIHPVRKPKFLRPLPMVFITMARKSGGPTLGAERGRRDAVLFEKGKSSGQGISGHRMSPVRSHFGSGKSGGPIWGAERGKRDAVLSEKGKSSGQAPLAKNKRYRGREKWRTYFGGRKGRLLPEKGRSSGQGIAGRSESPVPKLPNALVRKKWRADFGGRMGRVRRETPPPKGSLVSGSPRSYPVTRPSPERKSGGPIWGADDFGAGRTLVVRENDGPPRGRWPCPVVPIGRFLSWDEWRTDFGGKSGGPT